MCTYDQQLSHIMYVMFFVEKIINSLVISTLKLCCDKHENLIVAFIIEYFFTKLSKTKLHCPGYLDGSLFSMIFVFMHISAHQFSYIMFFYT